MLEVVVAFIWLALSYIVYYMIDKEEARKSHGKMFSIFTGFGINSILCFAYSYAVSNGSATIPIIKAGFIINSVLYLYMLIYSNIVTSTEKLAEGAKHFFKRLSY